MWHKLFIENRIPKNGVIVEVAPGYEPKIGNALALFGFNGAIFLIEPDPKAAHHIQKLYQQILPRATVKTIIKHLQEIEAGVDVPCGVDALVASHPFDDMVMDFILRRTSKKLYDSITDKDYINGIQNAVKVWQDFMAKSKPACFIASQYPSRTLRIKGLTKRQNSGFVVLGRLKSFYQKFLRKQRLDKSFGWKGDPKWWVVVKKPYTDLILDLMQKPLAIKRLGKSIFVAEKAKRLNPLEYDIVYVDNKYFESLGYYNISTKQLQNFAITLNKKGAHSPETLITYADRQKDKTDISLSGNLGSGRAVYCGDRFNVLGVGKTALCKSIIPSHSTGRAELIGCMRRVILSKWINYFTLRAPEHPLLIALKETARFKWNSNPVPLALVVRVDDGSLDRPNHVEFSPKIHVDFEKTLTEYARLDAELFTHRIMLGAWSTGNYSLGGQMIDLESASFVKYRAPYYTSASKYPHNRFGYEGLGFLRILHQLANVKNLRNKGIESRFYKKRRQHLGRCFLSLLGVADNKAKVFFLKYQDCVMALSDQFEKLATKIGFGRKELNLYEQIPDDEDPSLLDISNLFRNLAKLYKSSSREDEALNCLIRKAALSQANSMSGFVRETKIFVRRIFRLIDMLDSEKCLSEKQEWENRLQAINQDLPTMFELNDVLRGLAEQYRLGKISAEALNIEITNLCKLPYSRDLM